MPKVPMKTPSQDKCACHGCRSKATHHLVALAWAKGYNKSSSPLTLKIGLRLCKKHAEEEAKTQNILTDSMWEQITAAVTSIGRAPPDRASVELRVVEGLPIDLNFHKPFPGRIQ